MTIELGLGRWVWEARPWRDPEETNGGGGEGREEQKQHLTGIWANCPALYSTGSPKVVTCWHLTFKCFETDASSFWHIVIWMDSFPALLNNVSQLLGPHSNCLCGAAYKLTCVKVQCFPLYVDTENCFYVFWICKSLLVSDYTSR